MRPEVCNLRDLWRMARYATAPPEHPCMTDVTMTRSLGDLHA